jgi:methyl-accepting chemotaxis protein
MWKQLSTLTGNSGKSDTDQANEINAHKLVAINRSQAVIEFDLDGTIRDANENFLNALGYRLDEIVGNHHRMFVESSEATSDAYAQFWKRLNQGEFFSSEYKRITKSGEEIWIQASYNPLLDEHGKPYRVIKFATDITERVKRDADYEGQLRAISKSQAVIEFTLDGTILTANENFLQTLGYQLSDVQGQHHRLFVEPDYANSNEYRAFWDQMKGGKYQSGVFKRLARNGDAVWIRASYNPIIDASGRPYKVVKFASDITEQQNLNIMTEKVLEETRLAVSALAKGDLTARMRGEFTGQFAELQNTVNECFERMNSTIADIRKVALNVTSNAESVAQGSAELNQRSTEQAARLEETSASMEEITSTVNDNASNAATANELVLAASEQAHKGGDIVRDAVESMEGLSQSSKQISEIIGVIDEIAFQTNLLALNASVEAARAGEQGRGFAVVASEVRNLAGRSASAAKEIKDLIEDSAVRVKRSGQLVNQSGKSLDEIVSEVNKVTDAISSISRVSKEQSLGISSVNTAITLIDELTQHSSSLVEQSASASENLNRQALELAEMVSAFTIDEGAASHTRPGVHASANHGSIKKAA